MKALIVSDSKHETDLIQTYTKQAGYDFITYSWLLKALDNIEEIDPQLVIINAIYYPKHWKILVQYILSVGIKSEVILFVPSYFDAKEQEEATYLGIKCVFRSFNTTNMQYFYQLINTNKNTVCNNDSVDDYINENGQIIFMHPLKGTLCSGYITFSSPSVFNLYPDKVISLKTGELLKDVSIKTSKGIKSIQATVLCDKTLTLEIN